MSAAPLDDHGPGGILGEVLLEQQSLTAVERFALRDQDLPSGAPASLYEDLIPVVLPGINEQFAFRVDLDSCTGCKACVTACHSLNGLDPGETWRRVGVLLDSENTQHTITGACHHCADPGCLNGCPVQAYEKDPITGIVRHLDDQCIGCQYCTLMCPYEVPQYNERLGIVRKCDMCSGRLAEGESPACVQGCPNGAISIQIVPSTPSVPERALLPTSAEQLVSTTLTSPTTRYVGAPMREPPSASLLAPANRDALVPNHGHTPLVGLLLGTQCSVGLVVVAAGAAWLGMATLSILWLALGAALAGQAASILHLGRPLYLFRAVLGLRTSWMSREALALGAYLAALLGVLGLALLQSAWVGPAAAALVVVGALGVFTQVMIYAATGRPSWTIERVAPRFYGTVLVAGSATGLVITLSQGERGLSVALAMGLFVALATKLAREGSVRRRDLSSRFAARVRAARLETEVLAERAQARVLLAWGGLGSSALAVALSLAGTVAPWPSLFAAAGAVAIVASEGLERSLFFAAESSRGMPGA